MIDADKISTTGIKAQDNAETPVASESAKSPKSSVSSETAEKPQSSAPKKSTVQYYAAVGRRKEAVARVKLEKGKGEITINGKPIETYFHGEIAKSIWQKPYVLTGTEKTFLTSVKVTGSGKASQLDAVVHGLARALIQVQDNFRPILKKAGMLTRDARVKERRKYGNAQKARKGKQSPKR